jgi:hypothetical protein
VCVPLSLAWSRDAFIGAINSDGKYHGGMNACPANQPEQGWFFNNSAENEATLKPLCERVDKLFDLPRRILCRYFAA